MDKKRLVGGIVFLGIGLSLIALGIYIKVVTIGNIIYAPLLSIQILMWSVVVCGFVLTVIGVIKIYKSRRS